MAALASINARSTDPTEISINFPAEAAIVADISRTIVVKVRVGRIIRLGAQAESDGAPREHTRDLVLDGYRGSGEHPSR